MTDVVNFETKKMLSSFRDLNVYQKAFGISLEIHKASLGFPKIEQYALGDQMRRASKSICANLAEGFGKQRTSKAEFKRFLLMSIGSCHEMEVWIDYCRELGYIDPSIADHWNAEYSITLRMLQALHNNAT